MSAIPTTQTVLKTVSRLMPNGDYVRATVGLRKLDRNRQAYWSATAEVFEARGKRNGRERVHRNPDLDPDMSGQCHDAILRAFPQLAPIVALHLSDPDGVPMYAVENGRYHMRNKDPHTAARLWRCEPVGLPIDSEVEAFVDAQRERWQYEAEQAWTVLEEIDS